jgi:hypothetical protein
MYMLEAHGISTPASGRELIEREKRAIPIFPDVSLYLLELAAIFGSGMLLISVLFPLNLPPQYSPQLAATYTPQPDWYFLWIYQILKISVFEKQGLPVALSLVTLVFILLIALPFIDRASTRRLSHRKKFVTVGAVFVAELIVLTVWGLLTPGQGIPVEQAILVLGGIALVVALVFAGSFRVLYSKAAIHLNTASASKLNFTELRTGVCFAALVGLGALSIGSSLDAIVQLALNGLGYHALAYLGVSLLFLGLVIFASIFLLYRLDFKTNSIQRHVRLLEVGIKKNESS